MQLVSQVKYKTSGDKVIMQYAVFSLLRLSLFNHHFNNIFNKTVSHYNTVITDSRLAVTISNI
jgi:hypothetical protein